jgi:acetyl esterase
MAGSLAERLRRSTGAIVVDGFFRGMSRAGRLHPNARPDRHGVELIADVPYADTGLLEHRLDVYRPRDAGPGKLPVLFYVHGGGFRILSKETHWIMALSFARRGYLVFNIGYRLAPRHPYPAAVADCCRALSWVFEHAARYGGDVGRIALAGESAGANLVTALAIATSYPRKEPWARALFEHEVRPRAALPACGILEVSNTERFRSRWPLMSRFTEDRIHEVRHNYFHGLSGQTPEFLELANPLLLLERGEPPARPLPAFLATCGTKDPMIWDTERLKTALDRMGVECEAHYYAGEMHAFHALVWRPNARRCWREKFRFLEKHLALEAP